MTKRRTLKDVEPYFGTDILLDYVLGGGFFEDGDLSSARPPARQARDLVVADGLQTFTQAIANRLKTRKGELTALGHPEYGSRHHELFGEPNTDRTRNLIKLYVLQALRREPRIEKVLKATVRAEHAPPREVVRIELSVQVVGQPTAINLVVPFFLEAEA